jgi:hypothetical protein
MQEHLGLTCTREGCHPELGNGCIDGLEAHECPHRNGILIPDEPEIEQLTIQNAAASIGTIRVPNGDAFTRDEADIFLRKNGACVIAVIGCPDAGKTTAAVMLYELIKRGRLGPFSFAGSKTIRGFQSRSFHSIFSSGLSEPDTERTQGSKPVEFLHLRVSDGSGANFVSDLMIADRTGEDFERCMKQPSLCAKFPEIERADHHVLLVDGKKLVNDELAALHVNEVLRIFLSVIRVQITSLQLVMTKYDKVLNSSHQDLAVERFKELEVEIRKRCGQISLSIHYLSARPSLSDDNEHLLGKGLEELMSVWMGKSNISAVFKKTIPFLSDGRPSDLLLNSMLRLA